MSDYTNEQIIEELKRLSERLGRTTISVREIQENTPFTVSLITYRFGTVGLALQAAGLQRIEPGSNLQPKTRYSDENLYSNLLEIEKLLGREPRTRDLGPHGDICDTPYRRLGKWSDVLSLYRKWKAENGITSFAELCGCERVIPEGSATDTKILPEPILTLPARKEPAQFYGEPINFRGLRHAPINEQGVVFLFGMVSRELGFNIEAVQQGFPDCEGKYLHDARKGLWAKARIEFEYKSSSFRDHGHNADGCDFIVCWINDWPECPVDVIELKNEIRKLPSV
jgi:hypothetical protein